MSALDSSDTADIPSPSPAAGRDRPPPFSSLVQADVWGLSDPGRVRPKNEDHFLISYFGRFLETVQTNLPSGAVPLRAEESGYAMLVADGMGGHAAGEVASRIAITTLINLVLTTPDWILRKDDDAFVQEVMRRAGERFQIINTRLTQEGQEHPALEGLGTTLTVAVSLGKDLLVGHVGDSRAYLYRHGQLLHLTHDHTLAQELADRGFVAPQDLPKHPFRHVLTQVLGGDGRDVKADVQTHSLEEGDCLLVCSDGLTDMVNDGTIARLLGSDQPAVAVCRQLIDAALEAGGRDNVTAIVARYRFPQMR
jgi:protein phosphatase